LHSAVNDERLSALAPPIDVLEPPPAGMVRSGGVIGTYLIVG
jgi:hypothetical protein